MKKKKVLYVSRYFEPNKGGSVSINENLTNHFSSDELCVLTSKSPFSIFNSNKSKSEHKRYYTIGEFNIKGKGDRFFVQLLYLFYPFVLLHMLYVIRKEKINIVVATFPDIFLCRIAYLLAKWCNIPFYTYFHNTYLENRPRGSMNYFAKKWQPKLFSASKKIFVMSEGMSTYYDEKYGDLNFIPLPHSHSYSFDENFLKPISNKQEIRIVMIGNFNHSNIDATKRCINTFSKINGVNISFDLYTHVPEILLRNRGVDTKLINIKGYINEDELVDVLQKYDIALLTHGFEGGYSEVEYKTIFPTRTIPLLASGIPIFLHSPKNSFLTSFVENHGCAYVNSSCDKVKLEKDFIEFISNQEKQLQLIKGAYNTLKVFDGKKIAETLKSELN